MITFKIEKFPKFENDSFLVKLENFKLSQKEIYNIAKQDDYLNEKILMFNEQNVSPDRLKRFADNRPSLRNVDKLESLRGSIYTLKAQIENGRFSYKEILEKVREMLDNNKNTRRCVVRIADSFGLYYDSTKKERLDVSCLNLIHYLGDKVRLVFRASDIENELFYDILTIYLFFIQPVYDEEVDIEIFASTAQNVSFLLNLEKMIYDLNN
jgi:hypothetical protein